MPKLIQKGEEARKGLMDDPVFVEAVRCLAGDFVGLKCESEEVMEEDDVEDEDEIVNCAPKRQKATEGDFFTWWKPLP